MNINFMNILFAYFTSVPVNSIANIYGFDYIIQYVDKECEYYNQEQPCCNSNEVCINPKMAHSMQDSTSLQIYNNWKGI